MRQIQLLTGFCGHPQRWEVESSSHVHSDNSRSLGAHNNNNKILMNFAVNIAETQLLNAADEDADPLNKGIVDLNISSRNGVGADRKVYNLQPQNVHNNRFQPNSKKKVTVERNSVEIPKSSIKSSQSTQYSIETPSIVTAKPLATAETWTYYRCNICAKTFTVSARLTRHYRTHTGSSDFFSFLFLFLVIIKGSKLD